MRLDRAFYALPTLQLARKLLGKHIVHQTDAGRRSGWIVEVEAYLWRNDPACHAARGMSNKNRTMFSQPGSLYVYCIHACWCMNVVSEKEGRGAAVLIRALQPTSGLELMQSRRGLTSVRDLTNGPGKLCQALDVHRQQDGIDLVEHPSLWIEDLPQTNKFRIQRTPRIGIREGTELMYRYFIDTNLFVSGPAAGHTGPRQTWLPTPTDTFSCPRDSSLLR